MKEITKDDIFSSICNHIDIKEKLLWQEEMKESKEGIYCVEASLRNLIPLIEGMLLDSLLLKDHQEILLKRILNTIERRNIKTEENS